MSQEATLQHAGGALHSSDWENGRGCEQAGHRGQLGLPVPCLSSCPPLPGCRSWLTCHCCVTVFPRIPTRRSLPLPLVTGLQGLGRSLSGTGLLSHLLASRCFLSAHRGRPCGPPVPARRPCVASHQATLSPSLAQGATVPTWWESPVSFLYSLLPKSVTLDTALYSWPLLRFVLCVCF